MRQGVAFGIIEIQVIVIAGEARLHRGVPLSGDLDIPAQGGCGGIDGGSVRNPDVPVVFFTLDILHQHPLVVEVGPGRGGGDSRERIDAVDGLGQRGDAAAGQGGGGCESADGNTAGRRIVNQAFHPDAAGSLGPETGRIAHCQHGFQNGFVQIRGKGSAGISGCLGSVGPHADPGGEADGCSRIIAERRRKAAMSACIRVDVRSVRMAVIGDGGPVRIQQIRSGGGDRDGSGLAVRSLDCKRGVASGSEIVHIDGTSADSCLRSNSLVSGSNARNGRSFSKIRYS